MLTELRGARLLSGIRGVPAADIDAVTRAVAAIGDAALALGPTLDALEVNPLWVKGGQVEALDALATGALGRNPSPRPSPKGRGGRANSSPSPSGRGSG